MKYLKTFEAKSSWTESIDDEYMDFNFKTIDDYNVHLKRLKTDDEYKQLYLKYKEERVMEYWSNLKPFKSADDVPALPNPLNDFYINRIIELGGIPKSELKDGKWYYGEYRNSNFGKWNSENSVFHHIRHSFGWYWDECNHFEDDDSFALFVPLREATPEEIKNELSKVEIHK